MMKLNLNTIFIGVLISIFGFISIGVGAERVFDRYDIVKAKEISLVDENGNIIISLSEINDMINKIKNLEDAQKLDDMINKIKNLEDAQKLDDMINKIKNLEDAQKLVISTLVQLENKLNNIEKYISELSKNTANKIDNNKPKTDRRSRLDPNKVYNIPDAGSIVLGDPDAKVTVIKWTDFQ